MAFLREQLKNTPGTELETLYREYTALEHSYELADGYSAESRVNGILNGLGFSE